MYPVSDQFKTAIRTGATILTTAELWRFNEQIASLLVESGTISDDARATVRRRCSLSLVADGLLPARHYKDDQGLWPAGTEIKLRQSIQYTNPTYAKEVVPLGVYRIGRVPVDDSGSGIKLSVEAFDRSRAVSRAKLTDVMPIKHNLDLATAIKSVIQKNCAWLTDGMFDGFMITDGTNGDEPLTVAGGTLDRDTDPWAAAVAMAQSSGCELFFDLNGLPVLQPLPDPRHDDPDLTYNDTTSQFAESVARTLDDESGYNGVFAWSDNPNNSTIPTAEVWDDDPDSPTYFDPERPGDSLYGPVPEALSLPQATQGTVGRAARARLNQLLGITESVELTALPMFAHQSNDVIAIKHDDINVDAVFILESFSLGLGEEGLLDAKARSRRVS